MSFHEALLLVIVALTIPAALRNFTALALVVSYSAYEGGWLLTRTAFPPLVCVMIDATVLAAIYCKEPAHDCWPYRDWRHQLCSAWLERSIWDRIVITAFPLEWLCYFLPLSPALMWHSLYWLTMAQFVAANIEGLQPYLRNRSAKSGGTRPDLTGMSFIVVGGERYG